MKTKQKTKPDATQHTIKNPYVELLSEILKDKKKSQDFLEKTGIYDKEGNLTQVYIPNGRTAP